MTADEQTRDVLRLAEEALEREPSERDAYLDAACKGDATLREEVGAFVRRIDSMEEDFLEPPQRGKLANALGVPPGELAPGMRVGAWEIQERIASGGMGIVYLGRRADQQFEKQVAIKVIKPGMDSEEILKRFDRERQVLARLEHSGIARLLDGGLTENGRSFLVMEFVPGLAIGRYCDTQRLKVRDRLQLFLKVCAAVRHAHHGLVIHRDIKPSNILVTEEGEPKLLDFGVAKVLAGAGGTEDQAELTLPSAAAPMTLEYASPEQVRGEPLTTASDVYSLGATLYELLAGTTPLQLSTQSRSDAEKIITTSDPRQPSEAYRSTRSDDTGAVEARARSRNDSPDRLRRTLSGDLDTIVLKALAKEPVRRYASVDDLVADIERYLKGLPVEARPDTWTYRTGRLVRRHAVLFTAAAVLILGLAVATGVSVSFWLQAVDDRAEAEREAIRAGELNEFFEDMFAALEPDAAQGRDVLVRDLLDPAAARLKAQPFTDPELRASLHRTLGRLYRSLGMDAESATHWQIVVDSLAESREGGDPVLIDAMVGLSQAHSRSMKLDDLERSLQQVEAAIERSSADNRYSQAMVLALRAGQKERAGDIKTALDLLDRSRGLCIEARGEVHSSVADRCKRRAILLKQNGRFEEAEQELEQARKIIEATTPVLSTKRASVAMLLADVLAARRDYHRASGLSREALDIYDRLHGPAHPFSLHYLVKHAAHLVKAGSELPLEITRRLETAPANIGDSQTSASGFFWNDLGLLSEEFGDLAAADKYLHRSLSLYEGQAENMPLHALYLRSNLGWVLYQRGKLGEAEKILRTGITESAVFLGAEDPRRVTIQTQLVSVLIDLGKPEEAEALAREAMATAVGTPPGLEYLEGLARLAFGLVLLHSMRFAEAEPELTRAEESLSEHLGPEAYRTLVARHRLAQCLTGLGRFEQAEEMLQDLLDVYEMQSERRAGSIAWTWNSLGMSDYYQRDFESALASFQSGVEALDGKASDSPVQYVEICNNLAAIQLQLDPDSGEETLIDSVDFAREHLTADHPERLKALFNLIRHLEARQRTEDCLHYRRELVDLCREAFGEDHPHTQEALRGLAALEGKQEGTASPNRR